MLHVGMDGWMGWDWMVIIGQRYSRSTLIGANKGKWALGLRDSLTQKAAVLLDFVQITYPPPSPQFVQLVKLFERQKH